MPATDPTLKPSRTGPEMPIGRNRDRIAIAAIALLLLVHLTCGVATARALSVTHDEYWHLPVGILNLKTGRFDYEPLNPPLTRLISAFATCVARPDCYQGPVEVSTDPTSYGLKFLRQTGAQHQHYFIWGRIANLVFSLVTGVVLAVWSWQWWGRSAAVVAALLWCTEPTVMAHASLVTPDAGLTCLTAVLWYSLWCYGQRPSLRRAVMCGLLLGLAQLTKFTAIALVPLVVGVYLVWMPWHGAEVRRRRLQFVGHLALLLVVSLSVLNLGYGGAGVGATLVQVQPRSATVTLFLQQWPILGQIPLPFPKSYLVGLDAQKHVMESQHAVYLDGAWSVTGFRWYFVCALLYKLPHILQALVCAGLGRAWILRTIPGERTKLAFIAFPTIALCGISSLSGMQLGIRYILPVFPFLCLLAGSALAVPAGQALSRWQWKLGVIVWLVAPWSLRYQPEHLAYFNEYAGGPTGGSAHLLDSNLDWGQDLLELQRFLDKQADRRWGVAYFGSVPPAEIGLRYDIPPGRGPRPGWYAVSINYVQGRPHVVFDEQGQARPVGIDEFGYFRGFTPIRRIGASILIYQINPSDIMRWQGP